MGSFGVRFGVGLGSFGVGLGSVWNWFEIVLGIYWGRFGVGLGSVWDRFGPVLGSVVHSWRRCRWLGIGAAGSRYIFYGLLLCRQLNLCLIYALVHYHAIT